MSADSCRAVCSVCGRVLSGSLGLRPRRIWVLRHNGPDDKPCHGHLFSNHQEVSK